MQEGTWDASFYLFTIFNEDMIIAKAEIKFLQGRNGRQCGNQIRIVISQTSSELATELKKVETNDNLQASRGLVKEIRAKQESGSEKKSSILVSLP
ncbi:hypothetical protein SLEP1_g48591 [Rubroshorea leprosula]|uniref:Uncharacterized protein n=1 Tax=Rubroshorea leprosula TaxID=152421 RepID=A0AAV5LUZ2_9ROSI|nr:hypothetical protein SLEP1_g48591 [Rubroshorea leprosula]